MNGCTVNIKFCVPIQTEIASPFDGVKADVYLFNEMYSKGHKCLEHAVLMIVFLSLMAL